MRSLDRLAGVVVEAGRTVLARYAARDHRRARWAQEKPGEFYHEVLRGLMRLAYCIAAVERAPGACNVEACGRGLRLGQSFRPRDAYEAGRALLDEAQSLYEGAPAKGLAGIYQMLLGMRPHVSDGLLQLKTTGRNRRGLGGSYFTPPAVVERLLDVALDPLLEGRSDQELLDLRICDPSCGGGVFLAAAARRIAARFESPTENTLDMVLANCIYGVDVDSAAVELCRFVLWLERPVAVLPWRYMDRTIRVGDALVGATPAMASLLIPHERGMRPRDRCDAACFAAMRVDQGSLVLAPFHWHLEFADVFTAERSAVSSGRAGWRGGFDLVIGNPPFLNRLEDDTAAHPSLAAFLRIRFGGVIRCYADAATAFLVLGAQLLRPRGRAALIQPQSLLAARDAGPARNVLAEDCSLEAIWFPTARIFDASVRVCAPVLVESGERITSLQRFGDDFAEFSTRTLDMDELARQQTWSPLVAELLGVPRVQLSRKAEEAGGVVGDLALVTADFRDQYYGLRGAVLEQADDARNRPRLVTTGLVDLAHCAWGERPMRFDGRRWHTPRRGLSSPAS